MHRVDVHRIPTAAPDDVSGFTASGIGSFLAVIAGHVRRSGGLLRREPMPLIIAAPAF